MSGVEAKGKGKGDVLGGQLGKPEKLGDDKFSAALREAFEGSIPEALNSDAFGVTFTDEEREGLMRGFGSSDFDKASERASQFVLTGLESGMTPSTAKIHSMVEKVLKSIADEVEGIPDVVFPESQYVGNINAGMGRDKTAENIDVGFEQSEQAETWRVDPLSRVKVKEALDFDFERLKAMVEDCKQGGAKQLEEYDALVIDSIQMMAVARNHDRFRNGRFIAITTRIQKAVTEDKSLIPKVAQACTDLADMVGSHKAATAALGDLVDGGEGASESKEVQDKIKVIEMNMSVKLDELPVTLKPGEEDPTDGMGDSVVFKRTLQGWGLELEREVFRLETGGAPSADYKIQQVVEHIPPPYWVGRLDMPLDEWKGNLKESFAENVAHVEKLVYMMDNPDQIQKIYKDYSEAMNQLVVQINFHSASIRPAVQGPEFLEIIEGEHDFTFDGTQETNKAAKKAVDEAMAKVKNARKALRTMEQGPGTTMLEADAEVRAPRVDNKGTWSIQSKIAFPSEGDITETAYMSMHSVLRKLRFVLLEDPSQFDVKKWELKFPWLNKFYANKAFGPEDILAYHLASSAEESEEIFQERLITHDSKYVDVRSGEEKTVEDYNSERASSDMLSKSAREESLTAKRQAEELKERMVSEEKAMWSSSNRAGLTMWFIAGLMAMSLIMQRFGPKALAREHASVRKTPTKRGAEEQRKHLRVSEEGRTMALDIYRKLGRIKLLCETFFGGRISNNFIISYAAEFSLYLGDSSLLHNLSVFEARHSIVRRALELQGTLKLILTNRQLSPEQVYNYLKQSELVNGLIRQNPFKFMIVNSSAPLMEALRTPIRRIPYNMSSVFYYILNTFSSGPEAVLCFSRVLDGKLTQLMLMRAQIQRENAVLKNMMKRLNDTSRPFKSVEEEVQRMQSTTNKDLNVEGEEEADAKLDQEADSALDEWQEL